MRCTYCMPRAAFDNHTFLPRADLLSFEEIERIARRFVALGVRKFRLTGGEPLLRRGIERLIDRLARIDISTGPPIDIAMTTNGVLLAQKAQTLKDAGLSRVTVSLDALSDEVFRVMSDSDVSVQTVHDGIAAAQLAGLAPIKINMVVRRGFNDHELLPMAEHFRHTGIVLRFIEYMDVGDTNGWRMEEVVSAREVLDRIATHYPLQPIDQEYGGAVAERWHYADGAGEIGVVASVTQAFCNDCTRMRLSTDGKLYNCLFAGTGLDLRSPLRSGRSDVELDALITNRWADRDERYSMQRLTRQAPDLKKIEMSYIGG